MPYITVTGRGIFEAEIGKKLVLAMEDNGVNILHRCGGKAKCKAIFSLLVTSR